MDLYYCQKRLFKDFTNLSLLFRRNYDGHIVSMHQAGTHWLRNLLTHVIAREYGLPIPGNIRSNAVVYSRYCAATSPQCRRHRAAGGAGSPP